MKKENIADLWPLLADSADLKDGDILRLNHVGTVPVHTDISISNAIDYYLKIGAARKEERLRYLQHYWTDKVRNTHRVMVNTPQDQQRSLWYRQCWYRGHETCRPCGHPFKKYQIYTVAIDYANVQGCRITPNIYTSTTDLDQLIKALTELAAV